MKKKFLITGTAGFIGFHLAKKILKDKKNVVYGLDNLNNYYSVKLKKDRLKILKQNKNFYFDQISIENEKKLVERYKNRNFETIYHLAAQAGVRYSLKNPRSYIKSNVQGFFNILELAKNKKVKKLIYASSSSIYGDQKKFPIKENFNGTQKNLYALSKDFNEKLAEFYHNTYKINLIGLRFFTVYGEWGRPDMLYYKYMNSIRLKKVVSLFNFGNHTRDFTYIDDVIDILIKLSVLKISKFKNSIFNICSGNAVNLTNYLKEIEINYGKKCIVKKIQKQDIEILKTHGDNSKIKNLINKNNFINYKVGLRRTVSWFKKYHLK